MKFTDIVLIFTNAQENTYMYVALTRPLAPARSGPKNDKTDFLNFPSSPDLSCVPTIADKILVGWAAEDQLELSKINQSGEITRIIVNPVNPSKNLLT